MKATLESYTLEAKRDNYELGCRGLLDLCRNRKIPIPEHSRRDQAKIISRIIDAVRDREL